MTVSRANTSITLNAHEPKTKATVSTVGPLMDATDVTIWARAAVNPELSQSIRGTFDVLLAYALNSLATFSDTTMVSAPLGGGVGSVIAGGTPTTAMCSLMIGADLIDKQQSHFIDRTFKRLKELWLETNQTAVVTGLQVINVGDNQFRTSGVAEGGEQIEVGGVITDPDGQTDTESNVWTVPAAPAGGWTAEGVADLLCQAIDSLVHIRCDRAGTLLEITPSASENTVEAFIRRV